MTRSDILNAVRDGACSKAFGEKCMDALDDAVAVGVRANARAAMLSDIIGSLHNELGFDVDDLERKMGAEAVALLRVVLR